MNNKEASQPEAIEQESNGLNLKKLWAYVGPGMLMAGAAVGTSHIVQSTRAGTDFGFQLLTLVLLINLLKYPFFEYGHRYAIATGENLLDGYKRMGKGFLYLFLALEGWPVSPTRLGYETDNGPSCGGDLYSAGGSHL